ncbi:MAG: hypothetical protein WC700_19665 [Gemmatimonadaceae bacterium]
MHTVVPADACAWQMRDVVVAATPGATTRAARLRPREAERELSARAGSTGTPAS